MYTLGQRKIYEIYSTARKIFKISSIELDMAYRQIFDIYINREICSRSTVAHKKISGIGSSIRKIF